MAYRELELTLLSARDLKNVNLFTRMDVYAVASISGDPMTRQCTPTDTSGGRNPSWNTTARFSVPPSAAAAGSGWIHVLLRSERALGDRDIGEVVVPLADLLASADGPGTQPPRLASYQVHTVHRCELRGVLNVSYRLGPVVAPVERVDDKPPIVAYPAPHQPFQPQNPAPPQPYYHPPHDGYASPQHFKPQNLVPPQPYQNHPPHNGNALPQTLKPQNPAPPLYQNHPPHNAYAPPLSPANGKSNGQGPTQVYMGPQTQIIFDGTPKPKPSYTSTQSNTNPVKTDHSWPKSYPQRQDTATWPNSSPKKHIQQDIRGGELAHSLSKMGSGRRADDSARPQALKEQDNTKFSATKSGSTQVVGEYGKAETRPKEAYANNRMPGGKADHPSVPKASLQHERVPSMSTVVAR